MKKKVFRTLSLIFIILLVVGVTVRNPVFVFSKRASLIVNSSAGKLKKHVLQIVNTESHRNYSNTDSLNDVAKYIQGHFEENCDRVELQKYQVAKKEYKNVICSFKGNSTSRIVVGAHYDVSGEQDGADDNASGVAGIIELSRMLKENKKEIHHDLEIVAFTLEEPPYFRSQKMGSYVHAKSLKEKNVDVEFMLSVEMIGYFSDEWWSQKYPALLLNLFFPIKGNFIALISGTKEYFKIRKLKQAFGASSKIPAYSLSAPAFIPGIDFSDHLNYWAFDYDAYMISDTSFYRNLNYHKDTDKVETLDFDKLSDVVTGLHGIVTTKY